MDNAKLPILIYRTYRVPTNFIFYFSTWLFSAAEKDVTRIYAIFNIYTSVARTTSEERDSSRLAGRNLNILRQERNFVRECLLLSEAVVFIQSSVPCIEQEQTGLKPSWMSAANPSQIKAVVHTPTPLLGSYFHALDGACSTRVLSRVDDNINVVV